MPILSSTQGANPRTKLFAFVKLVKGRRLGDLTVISTVQDDIKGLNPINLVQEELTLMDQPYSDADFII